MVPLYPITTYAGLPRFSNIKRLQDDLALALRVPTLSITRGNNGITLEFPNPEPKLVDFMSLLVEVRPLPASTFLLGLQNDGVPLLAKLSSPDVAHVLISGATGAGKSVLLRVIAASLILSNAPNAFGIVAIDPKGRTFPPHFRTAHLTRPVITEPTQAKETLRSLVKLMEIRDKRRESLPRIAICIDELADLIMTVDSATEHLTRLLQRGREAGLHVIAATQRPSAAILSGLMRANFPLRLVGKVVTAEDARIASGRGGTNAHLLSGRGDFLAVCDAVNRFQVPYLDIDTLKRQTRSIQQTSSSLALPVAEVEEEITLDDVEILAQRLEPWWAENGNEWGSKTGAVKFLFGDDAKPGGYPWQMTMEAIERLETA